MLSVTNRPAFRATLKTQLTYPSSITRGHCRTRLRAVAEVDPLSSPCLSLDRSGDYYSSVPPPQEDNSIWGWLTGTDDESARGGGYGGAADEEEDTFTWLANSANFYAGEVSRNVKSMTDAIAEELLGPAEDEETRGTGEVVAGGATMKVGRRQKKKEEAPKPKKKAVKKVEDDDDDDAIGGFLNLLGLEDDEEEEVYVRRDCKKDK